MKHSSISVYPNLAHMWMSDFIAVLLIFAACAWVVVRLFRTRDQHLNDSFKSAPPASNSVLPTSPFPSMPQVRTEHGEADEAESHEPDVAP